ncbi:hypothetical protein C8R45DRAFT_938608 [Mycena sanguinolenta]|nr:hypothetical protein C8R45DRAFT_938608 [Mycena sanguinolenta]
MSPDVKESLTTTSFIAKSLIEVLNQYNPPTSSRLVGSGPMHPNLPNASVSLGIGIGRTKTLDQLNHNSNWNAAQHQFDEDGWINEIIACALGANPVAISVKHVRETVSNVQSVQDWQAEEQLFE